MRAALVLVSLCPAVSVALRLAPSRRAVLGGAAAGVSAESKHRTDN